MHYGGDGGGGATFEICLKEKINESNNFEQASTKLTKLEADPTRRLPSEHRWNQKARMMPCGIRLPIPISETTRGVSEYSFEECLTADSLIFLLGSFYEEIVWNLSLVGTGS